MPNFAYLGPAKSHDEALDRLRESTTPIAVDTETIALKGTKDVFVDETLESLDARTMIGLGIALGPTEAFYFPMMTVPGCEGPSPDIGRAMRKLAQGTEQFYWNATFDFEVISTALNLLPKTFHDVGIASQVQGFHNALDMGVGKHLGIIHQVISDILPKGKTMLDLPFTDTAFKCMNDVMDTWKLGMMMRLPEWTAQHPLTWSDIFTTYDVPVKMQECYLVDHDLVPIMHYMTSKGVKLDHEALERWYTRLAMERLEYEDICHRIGFEPGSNQQVAKVLTMRRNWVPFTSPKKGQAQKYKNLSVSEEVLQKVNDPIAPLVLEWRSRNKLITTYFEPAMGCPPKKGKKKVPRSEWTPLDRFIAHFRQDLATGRLGSFDRNIQNIPWYIREIFEADDSTGLFTWMDLAQVEMRLFAHIGNDPTMLREISEGINIHAATQEMFWPGTPYKAEPYYNNAKTFNFAEIFDATREVLNEKAHIGSVDRAEQAKLAWDSKYHIGVANMEAVASEAVERGWLETIFGNRIKMPAHSMGDKHLHNCGRNYPIQAPAAQVIKRIMKKCWDESMDLRIQVHDELVVDGDVEFPEEWSEIVPGFPTPFEVKKGRKWT